MHEQSPRARLDAAIREHGRVLPDGRRAVRFEVRSDGYDLTLDLDLLTIDYEVALRTDKQTGVSWFEARFHDEDQSGQ